MKSKLCLVMYTTYSMKGAVLFCYSNVKRYFVSVTNQLLSAGTPLRQLNIGE